jgi:hypothetical protein
VSRRSRDGVRAAAVLFIFNGVGFGAPTLPVARFLKANGRLPSFFGLFPMYGGPWFDELETDEFVRRLEAFGLVCAGEVAAGSLLWKGRRSGGVLGLALLPAAAVFWRGFALPLPVAGGAARTVLLLRGWKHLG